MNGESTSLEFWKKIYPEKFASENEIFKRIHREDTVMSNLLKLGSLFNPYYYLVRIWQ